MNISGKRLKNFILMVRYFIRAVKNIWFFSTVRTKKGSFDDAILVVYRKSAPLYWLIGDPGLKDRIAYRTLKRHGFQTRVVFDPSTEELQSIPERLVWFNPHHFVFGKTRHADGAHAKNLSDLISLMETGGRKVYPASCDILFWENKFYMHKQMADVEIRHPHSILCNSLEANDFDRLSKELGLPFLIKSPDGYSSNGLVLVKGQSDFSNIMPLKNVIAQEFLNITMDLRLIMVNGVTESFYWRKNPRASEWKPTATSGGATVQFADLPTSAEKLGKEIYDRFGIETFGADICWRDDDTNTEPYILEFSPIYQPNPIPSGGVVSRRYSDFKERTISSYDQAFETLVGELFSKQLLRYRANLRFDPASESRVSVDG
jgi:hypothetical protein